ncbi:vWA domain-containing protein [Glycomyces buryatensis]|uniref:vWA domain-containing protein n=1 Tax=Glycomyces buryatensis TaxID=2570927 RepID=UPI0014562E19|nr:substrate-binding domain-containing protein [Glycomyces buryatensis]
MSTDAPEEPEPPASPAAPEAAGPRELQGVSNRALSILTAAAGFLCAALAAIGEIATGAVRTAAFAAAIVIALGFAGWLLYQLRPSRTTDRRTRMRRIAAVLVPILVVTAASVPVFHWVDRTPDCQDPIELTVLVPEDGAYGFEQAIADFNGSDTTGSDCRRANITTYSAPWPQVWKAFEAGWAPVDSDEGPADFDPLRDVGPEPDLWVAESQTQVELAGQAMVAAGGDRVIEPDSSRPLGWTPLVMAVPGPVFESEYEDEQRSVLPLGDLARELRDELGMLRSDPTVSYTALTALRSLYDERATTSGTEVEKLLASSVAQTGLAIPGSDTDLMCDMALREPEAALITTERALSSYNRGEPLGANCPLEDTGRAALSPVYLQGAGGLDYQAVRPGWGDPGEAERAEVADALSTWLAGDETSPLEAFGIRGNEHNGGVLGGDIEFDLEFEDDTEPLATDEPDALLEQYGDNRVPTNVLLAIDHSQSMDVVDGQERSRFDLAVEGVRTALGRLDPKDRAGMWTFPAEGGDTYVEVLGIAEGRSPDDADLLYERPAVTGIDLNRTIVDGVDAVEAASEEDDVKAMVVLTDGADEDSSSTSAAEVGDYVANSEVSVYVIAVGEASCRSKQFTEMTADSRITCLEADEDQIRSTFDSLFHRLWS